jgi:hypothetical protein
MEEALKMVGQKSQLNALRVKKHAVEIEECCGALTRPS